MMHKVVHNKAPQKLPFKHLIARLALSAQRVLNDRIIVRFLLRIALGLQKNICRLSQSLNRPSNLIHMAHFTARFGIGLAI